MADTVLRTALRAVTPRSPQAWRLALLAVAALLCVAGFMTLGANGQWSFVIPFRGGKLAAMLLVAYAVAVSSVLFQTCLLYTSDAADE